MLKKNLIVMKKNMKINLIGLLVLCLVSCTTKVDFTQYEVKCVVDSVEYHGIGQDHTLQTTPYSRVHLKEMNMWVKSYRNVEVGDTMSIIVRDYNDTSWSK